MSPEPPTIVLIGLRGSGKSTIGALLAQTRQGTFIDLDDRTPAELGCRTVAEAFAKGEPAFREAEVRALQKCLDHPPVILALGGGTPTAPGAAALLRQAQAAKHITIVYLRASEATLRHRLTHADNAHRPALLGGSAMVDEVGELLNRRDPLYTALADTVVDVDQRTPVDAAALVASMHASS